MKSVSFETRAHAQPGHFTVPKAIAEQLGSGDSRPIRVRVESNRGLLFEGRVDLASGTEVYPRKDDPKSGLRAIRGHEQLLVTAFASLDGPRGDGAIVRAESVASLVQRRIGNLDDPWDLALVQRDRLWDSVRISRLLDSLLAGYPIGSLLLCEVLEEGDGVLDVDTRKRKRSTGPQLLDGQQRINALAALFGGLAGYGAYYLHMTKDRPREELATGRRTKVQVTEYIVHRDSDQDEIWRPIRDRAAHLRLDGFARFALDHPESLADLEAALDRGLAGDGSSGDLASGLAALGAVDKLFVVPPLVEYQRRAASRTLDLLRAWRSPVPVEQRRLGDAIDVLQVFERVNLEGVRVAGEDVFFAAVKLRLPDAEELVERLREAAPFLSRRGALRLAARLGSLAADQGDLLPLRVERLNGKRGQDLRLAIDAILDPAGSTLRRIEPIARRLMDAAVLGHALEYISPPLLDHVLGWAAASAHLEGAAQADVALHADAVASYLVGATAYEYWPVFEESFSVMAMESAVRAGLSGDPFPGAEIRARVAARWPGMRRGRRAVRPVLLGSDGYPTTSSALDLADRSDRLILSLAQRIPYELPERPADAVGAPMGRRQVEWDHIWPQARADRFRQRRQLAEGARAIWRAGNLWALDRPLNTSASARLPRDKFALLEALPSGGLPSLWPEPGHTFLEASHIEEYKGIEDELGLRSSDEMAVARAAERLRRLVDARATAAGLLVLGRFPAVHMFGRSEADAVVEELEQIRPVPIRGDELRAALRVTFVSTQVEGSQANAGPHASGVETLVDGIREVGFRVTPVRGRGGSGVAWWRVGVDWHRHRAATFFYVVEEGPSDDEPRPRIAVKIEVGWITAVTKLDGDRARAILRTDTYVAAPDDLDRLRLFGPDVDRFLRESVRPFALEVIGGR